MPNPDTTQQRLKSPAEIKAEDALRERLQDLRDHCYRMLHQFVRGDMKLEHCGYKSLEEATRKIVTNTARDIERAIVAHEKKFPL